MSWPILHLMGLKSFTFLFFFTNCVWSRWASFFLFCRTVFSAGNATGKLFHFDTKTCDLLEEISLGEGQINVLKYSPKVCQYQLWSFKFGDKVQIFWEGHKFWKNLQLYFDDTNVRFISYSKCSNWRLISKLSSNSKCLFAFSYLDGANSIKTDLYICTLWTGQFVNYKPVI